MMAALPTRIRQNIRDHITSPTSPLALGFKDVSTTLGYPITFDPEWSMLFHTLSPFYPDASTFIPSITATVSAWCDAFTSFISDDDNEETVDQVLEHLKGAGRLELTLQCVKEKGRARTEWDERKGFVILLPAAQLGHASSAQAGFASDFLELFKERPVMKLAGKEVADEPDWADVEIDAPETRNVSVAKARNVMQEEVDVLPEVATIQRPEELIKKPPYWMIVRQEGRSRVVVEGSHGPSLVVLEAYLKKWCRGDVGRVDRPPAVEIKLKESLFGLGLLHDTLVLEASRGREVNATLVLVLVEGVLGYEPLQASGSAGSIWEFKRTKGFR